ncbi:hypothetical protein ABW21_db0201016 [Orbilia brochopaga]|nr:hypothetical protein ABW21_db0201016 [Drechslerella brochopaga]
MMVVNGEKENVMSDSSLRKHERSPTPTPSPGEPPAKVNATDDKVVGSTIDIYYPNDVYNADLCSCQSPLCSAGPSKPYPRPLTREKPIDEENRVIGECERKRSFNDYPLILETFVEHSISSWPLPTWRGGTWQQRERFIMKNYAPGLRGTLLILLNGSTRPSPDRASWYDMMNAPTFSAADVAEALYHTKCYLNGWHWKFIRFLFQSWVGCTMEQAWRERLGDEDVYGKTIVRTTPRDDRRFRIFRAWRPLSGEYIDIGHTRGGVFCLQKHCHV